MPITQFPDDLVPKQILVCAICGQLIPPDKATAGLFNADNFQLFACNAHFWESNRFIVGWIEFAAQERLRVMHAGRDPGSLTDGGGGYYARLVS